MTRGEDERFLCLGHGIKIPVACVGWVCTAVTAWDLFVHSLIICSLLLTTTLHCLLLLHQYFVYFFPLHLISDPTVILQTITFKFHVFLLFFYFLEWVWILAVLFSIWINNARPSFQVFFPPFNLSNSLWNDMCRNITIWIFKIYSICLIHFFSCYFHVKLNLYAFEIFDCFSSNKPILASFGQVWVGFKLKMLRLDWASNI